MALINSAMYRLISLSIWLTVIMVSWSFPDMPSVHQSLNETLTAQITDITITVATTLWNKLILVWPEIFGKEGPQSIGLLGPVTLTYVKDIVVNL